MMQIKFNFNNFARVCHSLAACQRHTPSSLAVAIGLSNNDVLSLRSLHCVRWLETALKANVYSRVFRVQVYMRKHELSTATTDDLWQALSTVSLSTILLSWRQKIDEVGQLLGRGLVSKDNRPMKCTTSKLLTCRVTNGKPIWSAFYVVSQSKNKAA